MNPFRKTLVLALLLTSMLGSLHASTDVGGEEASSVEGLEKKMEILEELVEPKADVLPGMKRGKSGRKQDGAMKELQARLVNKAPELDRFARFILDWADSSGGSSNAGSGYTTDSGKTANLFNLGLDTQVIGDGIFKPDNIAIHVGQNFFNFASSTVAWLIAGSLYSNTNAGRSLFGSKEKDIYSVPKDLPSSSYGVPETTNAYASPVDTYSNPGYAQPALSNYLVAKNDVDESTRIHGLIPAGLHESPFFQAYQNQHSSYESRKMLMEDESSLEDEMEDMSMGQLQQLLRQEEEGKKKAFNRMTEEQKMQMYSKAKAMLSAPQQQQPAISFPTDQVQMQRKPVTTTVRRRRKMLRKPANAEN